MVLSKFALIDKVAIVSGGGRGMGRTIALALAEAGADVCIAARTKAEVEETAAKVRALGRKAVAVPTDVRDSAQVDNLAKEALAQFGRVDILINHVGGGSADAAPILETSNDAWERTLRLNVTSMFYCCRAVGGTMAEQKRGGAIINTSSIASVMAPPDMTAYSCAKAAVNQLTRCLAVELAPYAIRVNAVLLGTFENAAGNRVYQAHPEFKERRLKETPLRRFGRLEEAPSAVVFLASDAASYVTGAVLKVTGGAALYG